jgi:MFS transporter, putative metabolite:H+ symporter
MKFSIKNHPLFSLALIVSALGFFVDVFDLLLFAIVRKPSLTDLGLNGDSLITEGEFLISIQMIGMILGGILFGILGDKKGRLSVLFGSILLYSIANFLNGLVTNIDQYIWLRFLAGLGLAGELGAGLTLVSESLPKHLRSHATGIIAGFGVFGAVAAYFMSELMSWRACYMLGGVLGFLLLIMRFQVKESGLYNNVKQTDVSRGNLFVFFSNRDRLVRYIKCILIGVPVWFVIGVLVTFSDKFGSEFGVTSINPGKAIMYLYVFVGFGDFAVGYLSERLKSRKKTYFIFYAITVLFCCLFFLQWYGTSVVWFYTLVCGLGFGIGMNVVYMTLGVEQFGTNLRATAAISIPNMVRGSLPIVILIFQALRESLHSFTKGAIVTAIIVFVVALIAAMSLEESHGKDLEYVE